MSTHSGLLGHTEYGSSGDLVIATVPAGQTYIVKDVRGHNFTAGAANGSAYIQRPGLSIAQLIDTVSIGAGLSTSWQGWVIAQAGDQIVVHTSSAALVWWVSGTVLLGTTP